MKIALEICLEPCMKESRRPSLCRWEIYLLRIASLIGN